MHRVLTVAWREFKYTALTKAFVFAALGVPLLVTGMLVLMPLLTRSSVQPLVGTVAVVDPSGTVAAAMEIEMEPDRLRGRVHRILDDAARESEPKEGVPTDPTAGMEAGAAAAAALGAASTAVDLDVERLAPEADLEAAKEKVRSGELVAVAVFPEDVVAADGTGKRFQLFVPPGFPPNHSMLLEGLLADAATRARTTAAGMDVDRLRAMVQRPSADLRRLSSGGGEAKEQVMAKMLIPGAFMMLLWMSVFVSANYLLTTTIEEKSNKVMEVLLSAVSPLELMAGKLLGQSMVSAVMLLAYGGLGLAGLFAMASLDLVPISHLVFLGLYFVMAYFMIASIMAGVGSAANDIHEAQSLVTPAMLVLMLPLMLWFPISENPNGMLATVTSFIPPLIPFVMILRVTAANEPVAAWQIALSLVEGYAAMVGMVWLASRVFRIGVLVQGKTPSPRELLRWMWYA
ncbi:MAG: ABC transporter permease [Phycisphaerales bacterium]|nr:ABC transporter permease [Phycisphaerales bacterium]